MKWLPLLQSIATLEETTKTPDVSRRAFMTCVTKLGVAAAAAVTSSVTEADASPDTGTGGKTTEAAADKTMTEANKVQLAESVDPDDPRQAYSYYYGRGRRVVRRTYRRTRRVYRRVYRRTRRVYRRTYRRTRRVVRRAYRRRVYY